ATDGGSVGPHYDQYDVFLLQAEGQREWRIGQMCSEHDEFLKETKLRLLAKFEETDRWLLEAGDMLYLPPRLAHYGISQGNGQTYSIGFRAPSQSELMHSLVDQIDASSNEDQRYGDPDLALQDSCGEISQAALQQVREFMIQALADPVLLSDTIGKLMTEAKYPQEHPQENQQGDAKASNSYLTSDLKYDLQATDIQRELHSRFAFNSTDENHSFYAGGKVYPINQDTLELAKYLTKQRQYNGPELLSLCENRDNEKLLLSLWQDGHFFSGE
ncbi:MAG: cupin domain-containing protein, partial [Oleispira sp.]|nr:cupin domain-containing protein [Oleispira sp.]